MNIYKKIFISLIVCLTPSLFGKEISVMYYNCWNYFIEKDVKKKKSVESRNALADLIVAANPDILMLCEMGRTESLNDLVDRLKKRKYEVNYSKIMNANDPSRRLGIISKIKPSAIIEKNNICYRIRPKNKKYKRTEAYPVLRGFLHSIFKFDNYKLHIITAHLKSRLTHYRYSQNDMRRYEARQLRYYVNDLKTLEKDANILIMGDMNDVYSSSPIETIRNEKKGNEKSLFDLKPVDKKGDVWTHWWKAEDSYSRIDYAFANFALLPEINYNKSIIFYDKKKTLIASDHRPLIITIDTKNKPLLSDNERNKLFSKKCIRNASSLLAK